MSPLLIAAAAILSWQSPTRAAASAEPGSATASVAVPHQSAEEAAVAFLDAFKALDTERFDAFFADDATMFFPRGPFPEGRVVGKEAVTAAFHRFFAMARERGLARLEFEPANMMVQQYSEFAIATFELEGNERLGRRSIVLRQDEEGWRIIHFHASAVAVAAN